MRRVGKWFFTALGSLAVLLAIGITSTIGWSPFLGPKARALTNRIFERTQQRLGARPLHRDGVERLRLLPQPARLDRPGHAHNGWQRSFRRGSAPYAGLPAHRGAEPYPRSENRSGQLD